MAPHSNEVKLGIPKIFAPLFTGAKRTNILYGGRGSGKSVNVGNYLVTRACREPIKVLCTRELQKSIKDSVHALLTECIDNLGLGDEFDVQAATIKGKNGSQFIFAGVRSNVNEIKSMQGVDVCWVEEAQAMSQQSIDVLTPTIRAPGSILIYTFNPFKDSDPVYKMAMNPDDNTLVIKANYTDNPYFPDVLRADMERDRKNDYDKYLWVWEGQCLGISKAQIFRGKYHVREFDTPDNVVFRYGADWGFSHDPTTLIRSFIVGNTLYIDHEAWEVGCDISATPELFDTVPGSRLHPIYADNARPETISAMQSYGFNTIAAEKWNGSVEDGISYLRSFDDIVIHPRCTHVAEEFDLYQYKVDPQTDEVLRIPVDKYNHCIDALRYSHTVTMRAKSGGKVYDCFDVDNIVPPTTYNGTVFVGTYVKPGRTLCCCISLVDGNLTIVQDIEIRGGIDFGKIVEHFPKGTSLTWFPMDQLENVAPNLVQQCIDYGVEPAVGSILPADNEATILCNRLFKAKQLSVFSDAVLTLTSLTDRVYMAGGALETKSQTSKETDMCLIIEYTVWRAVGRLT